jgi:hypothetical protein
LTLSKLRRLLAGAIVLASSSCAAPAARAQDAITPFGMSAPVFRGTRGAPHFPGDVEFAAMKGILPPPHLDPLGKPCIELFPVANAQTINSNIYDHDLLINNRCSQRIRLSACYYRTRTCSTLAIAGYTRQLKLLGIFAEKEFRVEYREYVD